MYENKKLQLLLTFELELLRNNKIQIINSELEADGNYVGREIVHGLHPYNSPIDTDTLESIAAEAAKILLKRGIYKTLYKIVVDDFNANAYCYFPVSFCTNFETVCDCVKSICCDLTDFPYDCEDFCIHEYLRENLTIYALEYNPQKDTLVISGIF